MNTYEEKQNRLLSTNCSLEKCIEMLRENSKKFSTDYLECQIDLVAKLYNLNPEEIRGAIRNDKCWCL